MTTTRRGAGSRVHFAEQFAGRFPGGASVGRLLDDALKRIEALSLGLPRQHQETHLQTGDDPLQTPGAPDTLGPNTPASTGTGPGYAYEDHVHAMDLLLDAKGDLLTHDGGEYTRKAVGADGLQLTAVAAEAAGLRWGPLALTPATITAGDVNDYDPGRANFYRLSSDSYLQLTGLAAGVDGEVRYATNVGTFDLDLVNEDAGSAAANRFLIVGAGFVYLRANGLDLAVLIYDADVERWRAGLLSRVVS